MPKISCSRCPYHAYDFCGLCGAPFCEDCFKAGCCGRAPAESGVEKEYEMQLDAVQSAYYDDLMPRRAS